MKWFCVGGFLAGHHWQKWETIAQGDAYSGEYDKLTGNPQKPSRIGFWEKQRRVCLLCGKSQLRVAKT